MSNDRDQDIVKSAIADTGSGLLEFLSALGQREAIAFGDGVSLPVRIKFDELPKHCMPRSSTARFTEKWQNSVGDEGYLEAIVDRWRNSSSTATIENMAMFAEAMNLPQGAAGATAPRAASASSGGYPAQTGICAWRRRAPQRSSPARGPAAPRAAARTACSNSRKATRSARSASGCSSADIGEAARAQRPLGVRAVTSP